MCVHYIHNQCPTSCLPCCLVCGAWSGLETIGRLEIKLSLALSCVLQPFFAFNTISGSCKLLQAYLTPVLFSVVAVPFISYRVSSCWCLQMILSFVLCIFCKYLVPEWSINTVIVLQFCFLALEKKRTYFIRQIFYISRQLFQTIRTY